MGTRTFTTFEKHPELVASLKKLNPKFNPHTMAASNLSGIATFEGRTVLILTGCFPHNCGGSQQIAAFEPATKRVYLLQPTNLGPLTEPSEKYHLYGEPDAALRAAMFSAAEAAGLEKYSGVERGKPVSCNVSDRSVKAPQSAAERDYEASLKEGVQ